jgi:alpha-tubulin suppressor-like RCC1 family protein
MAKLEDALKHRNDPNERFLTFRFGSLPGGPVPPGGWGSMSCVVSPTATGWGYAPQPVKPLAKVEGSPLMLAVWLGFEDVVALLLRYGADPLLKLRPFVGCNDDLDAYELALALRGFNFLNGSNAMLSLLLKAHEAKKEEACQQPDVYMFMENTKTLVPLPLHPDMRVKKVACGDGCSALLTDGGSVYTWGRNSMGKLGLPDKAESKGPRKVFGALAHRTIADLAVGKDHMICCDDLGRSFAWGVNKNRQLGFEHANKAQYFVEVPEEVHTLRGLKIVSCEAGEFHSLFLSSDGFVLAAGLALQGRLGAVPLEQCSLFRGDPIVVPFGGNAKTQQRRFASDIAAQRGSFAPSLRIVKISCGKSHSAALDLFGNVHCWGMDPDGRCGVDPAIKPKSTGRSDTRSAGDLAAVYFPAPKADVRDVSHISCGAKTTCCTLKSGGVVLFGDGHVAARQEPKLNDVRIFVTSSALPETTAAITNSGELWHQGGTVSCLARLTTVSASGFGVLALAGRDRSVLGEVMASCVFVVIVDSWLLFVVCCSVGVFMCGCLYG